MTFNTKYKAIYRDIYNLHEKYAESDNFGNFIKEMAQISNEYQCDRFIVDLIIVIIAEIERDRENRGGLNES